MKNNLRFLVALVILILVVASLIWAFHKQEKVAEETATPILSVSSFNQTQNKGATLVTAKPDDILVFTLSAENHTTKVIPGYVVEANISEVTDKSTLIDGQGASYNAGTSSLIWTPLDIPAGGSIQKQFSVRINPMPANSASTAMKIRFNNEIAVAIAQPTVSGAATDIPSAPYKAPVTGPAGDLSVWLALVATSGYFLSRKYRKDLGITRS